MAVQQPKYEEYKTMIGFELRNDLKKYSTNSKEEDVQSEKGAEGILKNDPYYKKIFAHKINYWIIVNKDHELLGPFTIEEYIARGKNFGYLENIELKF